MKKITIAFFIFLCFDNAFSTGQQQDIIFYNNSKAKLTIEVACPSPLELYFKQTKQENPFTMLHTANSRGHVATWKINHNTLFLKKINRPGDIIDLKMIFPNMPVKNPIKATWFSGYILIKAKQTKPANKKNNTSNKTIGGDWCVVYARCKYADPYNDFCYMKNFVVRNKKPEFPGYYYDWGEGFKSSGRDYPTVECSEIKIMSFSKSLKEAKYEAQNLANKNKDLLVGCDWIKSIN